MNNFARAPFARNRVGSQTVCWKAVEGVHYFFVAGGIFCDEVVSFFGCHRCCSSDCVVLEAKKGNYHKDTKARRILLILILCVFVSLWLILVRSAGRPRP